MRRPADLLARARRTGTCALVAGTAAIAVLAATPSADPPPGTALAGGILPGSRCNTGSQVLPDVPWQAARLRYDRLAPFSTGEGVVVAVLDTGVDATHPQLVGAVLPGTDVTAVGLPTPPETPPPTTGDADCTGHGTFVAGMVAARPSDDSGVVGIAPGATILPVRVTGNPEEGSETALAAGVDAAVAGGADVINISIVTYLDASELRSAVARAVDAGVVVVAAVGNDGGGANRITYPAAYPDVIAVGAVDPASVAADFSQTSVPVSVVAPGVDVISTIPGTGHSQQSGTSFATPVVAGLAALVLAEQPGLSPAEVKRRLEVTADPAPGARPDVALGWGVVNPYQALTTVLPGESPTPAPPPTALPAPIADPPPDTSAQDLALVVLVVGGAAAVLTLVLRAVVPAGRRRRWQPAASATSDPDPPGMIT